MHQIVKQFVALATTLTCLNTTTNAQEHKTHKSHLGHFGGQVAVNSHGTAGFYGDYHTHIGKLNCAFFAGPEVTRQHHVSHLGVGLGIEEEFTHYKKWRGFVSEGVSLGQGHTSFHAGVGVKRFINNGFGFVEVSASHTPHAGTELTVTVGFGR